MATPFDDWTLEDAKAAVQAATGDADKLKAYRAYMEGDHWQNWAGWTGPVPDANDPERELLTQEIERGFVSRGVVREVIDRHVNGVLGRDVKWQVVPRRELAEEEQPTPEEQARIDEATAVLRHWVDLRKLNTIYDEIGRILSYAGQALQRIFVAPGALDEHGFLVAGDVLEVLNHTYVNFLHPGESAIYTDPHTQARCSIYLYREQTSHRPSLNQQAQGDPKAELTYVDEGLTVLRILGPTPRAEGEGEPATTPAESAEDGAFAYDLGERLMIEKLERPALITDQVVSQQKLLNKTLSMKGRNMDLAGFRERVVTNAQMGGSYQSNEKGEKVFVPHTLPAGPSALTNLTGYILKDKDGNETLVSPTFQSIDPVPVTSFLQTEESAYLAILAEVNQLHYAMSADAAASGISRETAMAAYLIDLLQTKQQIDLGFAWLLETALALASTLSGVAGRFADLRVSAEAAVDPGPISPEMIRVIIDLWREERITLRTGLNWIGIEDIDGEIAGLHAEAAERAERFPESTANERQFGQDFWNQLAGLEE